MEDTHQMYPWFGSIYVFLVLGSILALMIIYGGTKLMIYLEKRNAERRERQNQSLEERQ